MSKSKRLGSIATYSEERVSGSVLTPDTYVGTDNLLQNKQGKTDSDFVPSTGSTTQYHKGDILIANIRPYLKKIWYADNDGGSSPDVLTIRIKDNNYVSKYLYYALFRDEFFEYMMKGSKGTKMPRGDKDTILDFPIPVKEKPVQFQISSILSALDDKIALNNKINKELEAMAKTLYDYWFVQFDFPNEKGKPYKSSGGKMIYNRELKREIPHGWRICDLCSITNITMGQSPDGDSYNENGDGIIFYQGATDFGNRFPQIRQYTTQPARFAKQGDILLSVRAPVGAINIANNDCCIGRGLAALNSKNDTITYVYEVIKTLKQIFDRRNTDGTTFGAITKDDLFSLKVVDPESEILNRFHQVINPMFIKMNFLEQENQTLASLRDFLLPMLMNGQITIKTGKSRETKK